MFNMLSTTVPNCVICARRADPDGAEFLSLGIWRLMLAKRGSTLRLMAMKCELDIQCQIRCSFSLCLQVIIRGFVPHPMNFMSFGGALLVLGELC